MFWMNRRKNTAPTKWSDLICDPWKSIPHKQRRATAIAALCAIGAAIISANAPPAALDPAQVAVMSCPMVRKLLGRVEAREAPDAAAWCEVDRTGAIHLVRLHARAVQIPGDLVRHHGGKTGREKSMSAGISREVLLDAMEAARGALRQAGIPLALYAEAVQWRQEQRRGSGGTATIALRAPPKPPPAAARKPLPKRDPMRFVRKGAGAVLAR